MILSNAISYFYSFHIYSLHYSSLVFHLAISGNTQSSCFSIQHSQFDLILIYSNFCDLALKKDFYLSLSLCAVENSPILVSVSRFEHSRF